MNFDQLDDSRVTVGLLHINFCLQEIKVESDEISIV